MRQVIVTQVYPAPRQTVWEAEGIDADNGTSVRFAGDWRPMQELDNAVRYGDEEVVANVEEWQVIG